MIRSFRSAALEMFYKKGISRKLPPEMIPRIEAILDRLNVMESIQDMRLPHLRLHKLKGERKDEWAVTVKGNYRITFRFVDGNVEDVDFVDYH